MIETSGRFLNWPLILFLQKNKMDEFFVYTKGQLWVIVGGGLCVLLESPSCNDVLVANCVVNKNGFFVKPKYKKSKLRVTILFDKPIIISINNLFSQIGDITCRKLKYWKPNANILTQ